ncbi:MAG TPA: type VII secretion protein EccCa, partial [Actinomycetota bacterium]|nr:type VII secretion protein EccCa [Actinomycetota bacterium]
HLHPDLPALWATIDQTNRLWERRPSDADFLTVRVGRGPVPLAALVRLDTAGGPLVEHDPELLEAAEELVRRSARVQDVPVTVPLRAAGVLALTGPPARVRALARSIVCELAAFHAPDDLWILAPHPSWAWATFLPHTRDPTAATGRSPVAVLAGARAQPGARPHLVAIVDTIEVGPVAPATDPGVAASSGLAVSRTPGGDGSAVAPPGSAARDLLDRSAAGGVTVLWLAESTAGEPSELSTRIRLDDRGFATLQETAPGGRRVGGIRADAAGPAFCEAFARRLAPLRLELPATAASRAGPVRLLDLLGPHTDLTGRADTRGGGLRSRFDLLRVPVGVTASGDPLVLDLKEAAEHGVGPHGLVIGATGSGKSELLRTVVAGLAATHPPEQLAFVLVDFKGGAAFADLARLPQVAGLITNLQSDLSMVGRAMAALQGELARRQRLLHLAGNQPDLRAYAARRAAEPRLEPLPSLLVVVDEFGELLAARPEFLDLFIAIGRVGRSLGMHLLLASQRLDEGHLRGLDSHLRFRICLRTFSAAESTAVLGVPDAYHLPSTPGTALIKVDASPPVPFTAALVSTEPDRHGTAPPRPGGQNDLEVLVGRRTGAGRPVHQVWLPPLAAEVALDPLLRTAGPGWLQMPVGVVDRPLDQVQEPLVLDLSGAAGHLAVVGAPRTGKSTLLGTLVAGLAATHPPDEVQVYAVDLGGGGLHRLGDLPHVGAVCGPREAERVQHLVRELRSLVLERERRFRDLGVDSMASWHELRRAEVPTGAPLRGSPDPSGDLGGYGEVVLVVDNWGAFVRELPELEAEITGLAAVGLHHGVHLVVAANRWAELRPGLRENLGGRLELRLNDPLESELGRSAAADLPDLPGRGLTQAGLQFQAALPGPVPDVLARAMPSRTGAVAPPLRLLPTLVGEAALLGADRGPPVRGGPAGLPFALEEHRLDVVRLDLFGGSPHLLVLGDAGSGKSSLLRLLARQLDAHHPPGEVALLVVDMRRRLLDLTALANLAGYACTPTAVAQAVDRLHRELTARTPSDNPGPAGTYGMGPRALDLPDPPHSLDPGPTGGRPRYVLLVDDYDLLPAAGGSPLLPLVDLLGLGRELGFHLVLARRVAGAARAGFEPVFQRLRELGGAGLVMSGDPAEGPLLGGQKAVQLPPGRGFLVRPGRPAGLVQVAYSPPPSADHPRSGAAARLVTTATGGLDAPGPNRGRWAGEGKCAGQGRETGCRWA